MIPNPNKYALTVSLPGMPSIRANAPKIGMVTTAIPDVEAMKMVNTMYSVINITINKAGGMLPTKSDE